MFSDILDKIETYTTEVALVGLAVVGLIVAGKLFKWVRSAI